MQRLTLTSFLLTICVLCFGQTKTWDGGGSSNSFADGANWNPDGVPGPADDLVIPFGNDVELLSGTYTIRNFDLSGYNSTFTVHEGAQLNIASSTAIGLDASGSLSRVINRGTINISNTGNYGLLVYGVFENDTSGVLNITNTNNFGIITGTADTIYNHGQIHINSTSQHGIYNTGTVNNLSTGTITITNAGDYGFRNGPSDYLNNYGAITIDDCVDFSLENSGTLTNHPGGIITILNGHEIGLNNRSRLYNLEGGTITIEDAGDGYSEYGINNDNSDSLFNSGVIHISHPADEGIYNKGYIINEVTGSITIDTTGKNHPGTGIETTSGNTFINAGAITITGADEHGIMNAGTFSNLVSGEITINWPGSAGVLNSAADTFNTAGQLTIISALEYGVRNYGIFNSQSGVTTIQNAAIQGFRNEFDDILEVSGIIDIENSGVPGLLNLGTVTIQTGGHLDIR